MKKNIMNKLIKIGLVFNTCLFIISFSISCAILFRPFYYWHINFLNLEEETGYTYSEIKEAYDDVLDYSVLNKPFSTGVFNHTEEGKAHFHDCKILFIINFIVLGLTSIILILKKKFFNKIKIHKYSIGFWSSCCILGTFILLTITSLIVGFNNMFNAFHNIFFLGKSNWLFNPSKDEIIKILPMQYFMDCAILVVSIIAIISITIIVKELLTRHNNK